MLTNTRCVTEEIMDRPDVDPSAHAQALRGLRRINVASRTSDAIAKPIVEFARKKNLSSLSMLDIACGGGDVPIGVTLFAKLAGLNIDLTLLDKSATALNLAAASARSAGISAKTIEADLLGDSSSAPPDLHPYDVVTCSLFLHHVPDAARVIALLSRIRQMARQLVVISDLRRCRSGLAAAWVGGRIFTRSEIVRHDAVASVRSAWTTADLRAFSASAGLTSARIFRCWPWRMMLIWEAPEQRS